MVLESSFSPSTAIVVMDASIKNDIATSILHVHIANCPLIKMLYHMAFVTTTEAKLFVIKYGINQACTKENVSKIIVVTDSIHVAKKIFNTLLHPYQGHTVAILSKLCHFFANNQNNSIEFWECSSWLNWNLHKVVDRNSKSFNPLPVYPYKMLWGYCKKIECDNIINNWKMIFQALDGKGRQFLDLMDNNFNVIEPSYTKGGLWLQSFGHSNLLYICAMRVITNHALIGKYWLRFFLSEEFRCPYENYPIESRRHILHNCIRFNGYWNPRWDFLSHFVMFLVANPNAFDFIDSSTSTVLSRP